MTEQPDLTPRPEMAALDAEPWDDPVCGCPDCRNDTAEPVTLPSDAALAELRAQLGADGVIPAPMPDQTPEPLTDEHLETFVFDPHCAAEQEVASMARELLAARTRATRATEKLMDRRTRINGLELDIDHARAEAGLAVGEAGALRARVMELQSQVAARDARIAELEAARANSPEIPDSSPDAYIAVRRYHVVSADGPEWCDDAAVIPAGHIHAWEREGHQKRGYQLLPIVADGDGTRFAATPPTRCQATTVSPLIDDRRSLWCELPAGHAGMHHAAVPQPGFPATEVDWDDTEEAGR